MQKTIIETINRPDFKSGKVYDASAPTRPLLSQMSSQRNHSLGVVLHYDKSLTNDKIL
jgi:hypothetical protein